MKRMCGMYWKLPLPKARGSITVYLTGILLVMLSVVLMLVEVTKWIAVKTESLAVCNMAMDSCFAEYHKALLEEYDLFFIDTSYGTKVPSVNLLKSHLAEYIRKNLNPQEEVLLWNYRDFLGLHLQDVQLTQMSLATDDGGRDVLYQATEYMRDKVGLGMIEDIQARYAQLTQSGMLTTDVGSQMDQYQGEIDAAPKAVVEVEEGVFEEVCVDSPSDNVRMSLFSGLLGMVVPDVRNLSYAGVNPTNYVSGRSIAVGSGASCPKQGFDFVDDILFGEYLMEKCGCYSKEKEGSELAYELEYVVNGQSADQDNLVAVITQLSLLRWAADAMYIYGDSGKVAIAEGAAIAIAAISLQPELVVPLKHVLLLAWAYMEAVMDVRRLLGGAKVPLFKTADDWCMSFEGMANYQAELASHDGKSTAGLDYRMYLRLLLLLQPRETKVLRLMDLIEMRIRKTEGNANFRLDGCVSAMEAIMTIAAQNGEVVQVTKQYEYMNR